MLNRTKAPATSATILPEISYAMPVKSNGLETTFLPLKEEVCRVDLVFNCGTLHQHKKALANGVKELLFSGTDAYTENQILTYLDNHGAYYGCDVDFNFFTISLYSTPQLVSEVFELFIEAIFKACFPEDKLEIYKSSRLASLAQNLEKTGYLAKGQAASAFYSTPLLKDQLDVNHINELGQEDLILFHKKILESPIQIYISGNIQGVSGFTNIIKPHYVRCNEHKNILKPEFVTNLPNHLHIRKAGAVQTSLRGIGATIGKKHLDYPALLLANTLFGGYFGSMLMQKIREEKGLTYGINSSLLSRSDYSIININADIKNGSINEVITEIRSELDRLKKGRFDDDYLEKTKNYILGNIAKGCDELFSNLDKSKMIQHHDLTADYYTRIFHQIKNISKEQAVEVANTYLNLDNICLSTCGDEQY